MKKRILLIITFCFTLLFPLAAQTSTTALKSYVEKDDTSFVWEVRDSVRVKDCSVYSLFMISQKWQDMLWKHELIVYVPDTINYDGTLLYITGGGLDENRLPKFVGKDNFIEQNLVQMAVRNKASVACLRQVPNQPLYNGLNEDALIAYTLNEFRKTNDYSWPLLFPMVKSTVRAMDTIEQLLRDKKGKKVDRFVLTGASKRGWTTWLTAAIDDPRVVAIAPMVIEMLNMPEFFKSQLVAYGGYSEEIGDYVKLQIPQAVETDFGKEIVEMIDPYSYFEKMAMPKLIIMAANDPFWTIDAIQNYIGAVPGEYRLHYVPNAGHNMGDKKSVFEVLDEFFGKTLNSQILPEYTWILNQTKKPSLDIDCTSERLVEVNLWETTMPTRDLRKGMWTSTNVKLEKGKGRKNIRIDLPKQGYKAFFVELKYEKMLGGTFSVCTSAYVADDKQVFVK